MDASSVLVLLAHPAWHRSRVHRRLAQAARTLAPAHPVEVCDLHGLYPDDVIDVRAEQERLLRAELIVWQHPIQWYGMPALMKRWVDDVLAHGWAYGRGGTALRGKSLWLVKSTGAPAQAWHPQGVQPTRVRRLPAAVRADRRAVWPAFPAALGAAWRCADRRLQDIASIPFLALLPLLGVAAAGQSGGGSQALLAVAVVLGGRLLLRPALRWIARSRSREIFTAAALLLAVGIAAGIQALGLSMALGAFLAGVLLADSEYRRELETDIEPFKGLLMGLFFMAVSMLLTPLLLLPVDRWTQARDRTVPAPPPSPSPRRPP